jgi:hypothetical protein
VKIEVGTVHRGSLFPPETKSVRAKVRDRFGPAEMPLLRFVEVYAGKMCAALDRQHPRDLFDIHILLENEGIDRALMNAFLAYLICHSRPIVELLDPIPKNLSRSFELEFKGMAEPGISVEMLRDARVRLIRGIHQGLSDEDREFLLELKRGRPDWKRFPLPGVSELPAVRWKMSNLERMAPAKHADALAKLSQVLAEGPTRAV